MIKFLVTAFMSVMLGMVAIGCSHITLPQLIFESPKQSEERSQSSRVAAVEDDSSALESVPGSWFQVFMQASLMSEEERRARLVALNTLINQPSQNGLLLGLEQATLLGVREASPEQWNQALAALEELTPEKNSDAEMYRSWLQQELTSRLQKNSKIATLAATNAKQAREIKQLKTDVLSLDERINDLNSQIEALTNIERNLTEKTVVQ